MPSASKYIVDVNKISKPGNVATGGIYIGTGSGNRESLYAVRGTGSGAVVIYDKVLYELSVDNMSDVEPNAQTVTFNYTSKRTHGNGTEDTLYINPTTAQITANESTANTKTTNVTVNQALTANGTTTGTGVTVSIVQKKDYPTGISFSISPNSTIPAKGGSITSDLSNYTYSVTANYKSGRNNVDITSDSNVSITASTTGVTASSKGTTTSQQTNAGTITFAASYTCNGVTKTASATVTIKQDANTITSYDNPTFTLSPGNTTLPAGGGSVTGSVSSAKQVRHYSSEATDTIDINNPSVDWTAQTISCQSRGSTTGNTLTLGTTYAKVTSNGKSTTKNYTVYQEANSFPYGDPTWGNLIITSASLSCGPIPVTGGTVYPSTGGTVYQNRRRYYTSGSYEDDTPSITASVSYSPTSVTGASNIHSTTSPKRGTVTATWTGNSSKTASKSVDVYQNADSLYNGTTTESTSLTTNDSSNIPTGGGTRTVTFNITQSTPRYWSSDDAYYDTQYTYTGSTTLSTSNCSVSPTSLSNGGSATVTIGSSSASRTVTVTESRGGKSVSWTQEGQSLLTPSINSVTISFDSFDPPTPTIGTLSIQLQNPTNKTIYLALSTNGEESGIVASGSMSPNNAGTLFTYKPTSKTQRLYCLIKASGTLNNYFGVGTGPQWGYWIDGVYGSGTAKSTVVGSSWQKITSSATYLPTGEYTEWGSADTNVPFFFANA